MANTPLGNLFSGLNRALDSRMAKAVGLRKLLERATYSSTFNGVRIATSATKILPKGKKDTDKAERLTSAPAKDLFDLHYSEEQEMIVGALRDFVEQQIKPSAEQCSEEGKLTEGIINGFHELGLAYYAVPESMGGIQSEQSTVTQMAIAETLAYGDVGVALALLTPLSALNALVRFGNAAQQQRYIPAFLEAGSEISASIAIDEPAPLFDPFRLTTRATAKGGGYVLTGVKRMVPLVENASCFLVAAGKDGRPAVFIVDAGTEGLTLQTDRGMGLRAARTGQLTLKDTPAELLLEGDDYETFIHLARLGWCAMAVGAGQAALEYVIEYCNNREAFGEPISHRQAVAFMIADMKIEVDAMRILTQRAASRAEQGLDFGKQTYLAHLLCGKKSMQIGTNAVQLLGGYGFCRDYPAERWYRDLRAVAITHNGLHL